MVGEPPDLVLTPFSPGQSLDIFGGQEHLTSQVHGRDLLASWPSSFEITARACLSSARSSADRAERFGPPAKGALIRRCPRSAAGRRRASGRASSRARRGCTGPRKGGAVVHTFCGSGSAIPCRRAPWPVQDVSLRLSADGHTPFPAALGPGGLQPEHIGSICCYGSYLDSFFPAEPEGLLQFQAHPEVRIRDPVQLFSIERLGAVARSHTAGAQTIVIIGSGHHVPLLTLAAHQRIADMRFFMVPAATSASSQCLARARHASVSGIWRAFVYSRVRGAGWRSKSVRVRAGPGCRSSRPGCACRVASAGSSGVSQVYRTLNSVLFESGECFRSLADRNQTRPSTIGRQRSRDTTPVMT